MIGSVMHQFICIYNCLFLTYHIVEKQKKILSKITQKDSQFINLSVTEKDTLFINVINRTLQPLSQFIQSLEWHLHVEEVSCTANKW